MTTHPESYPPLKVAVNLRRMESIERTISRRSLYYIPKEIVRVLQNRIVDGDIIAITTNTEGLDVQHVEFAVRVKNRIHLLHASSAERKVVLARQTLYRYLIQSRACSGIMVARLVWVISYKGWVQERFFLALSCSDYHLIWQTLSELVSIQTFTYKSLRTTIFRNRRLRVEREGTAELSGGVLAIRLNELFCVFYVIKCCFRFLLPQP